MQSIVYITNNYPLGGTTEEAFMKPEILAFAKEFQKVIILPMRRESECRDISFWPDNVVLDSKLADTKLNEGKSRYLLYATPLLLYTLIKNATILSDRKKLNYLTGTIQEGIALSRYIRKSFAEGHLHPQTTEFYTFWFANASIGLSLLPKKMIQRWISRAHGYDLYNERVPVRSKVLRERAFRNVDKVLTCSKDGENYLKSRYPKWIGKIETLYLGTEAPAQVNCYSRENYTVRFITIARIEPVKRILQTFDTLSGFAGLNRDIKVVWTVIGGGSLLDDLKAKAQYPAPDNMTVILLGEKPNTETQLLLQEQSFDWMILLSESEGLPISIAEGMTHGIPTIATDVGGVKEEVINGVSGLLLKPEPNSDDFTKALLPYIQDNDLYLKLRESTRKFWSDTLDGNMLKQKLVNYF